MKKCLLWILISLPVWVSARVWRVDNNTNPIGDTTYFQGAINAASTGDTLIIQPSFLSYGTVIINKRLFVYGAGHQSAWTTTDKSCTIGYLEVGSGVSGLVLAGLRITDRAYLNGSQGRYISNEFRVGLFIQGNQNHVEGNLINGFFSGLSNPAFLAMSSVTGTVIQNNYFSYRTGGGVVNNNYGFITGGDTGTIIRNNLFIEVIDGGGGINNGGIVFFRNSLAKIYNNICWSNVASRTDFDSLSTNADFQRNITYSAQNQTDTLKGSNFNNIMPSFTGAYNNANLPFYRQSNRMQLNSSSVGVGTGTDGKDVGIYGGTGYFHIEGKVPWVGFVQEFIIQQTHVPQGGNIHINLKINTSQ